MEPKVFTDIEVVNRLQMSRYRINVESNVPPHLRMGKVRVVFTADRGEPEFYRTEISFRSVEYLVCPFHLPFNYSWRMATPEEHEKVIRAHVEFDFQIKDALQQKRVYCLEEEITASNYDLSADVLKSSGEQKPFFSQRTAHTFFVVAYGVEILVYYGGDDLDTYLKQIHDEFLLKQAHGS